MLAYGNCQTEATRILQALSLIHIYDEYRKTLDKQFKEEKSNFKIAIVVDMWITGFDVPSLDTMYLSLIHI